VLLLAILREIYYVEENDKLLNKVKRIYEQFIKHPFYISTIIVLFIVIVIFVRFKFDINHVDFSKSCIIIVCAKHIAQYVLHIIFFMFSPCKETSLVNKFINTIKYVKLEDNIIVIISFFLIYCFKLYSYYPVDFQISFLSICIFMGYNYSPNITLVDATELINIPSKSETLSIVDESKILKCYKQIPYAEKLNVKKLDPIKLETVFNNNSSNVNGTKLLKRCMSVDTKSMSYFTSLQGVHKFIPPQDS
jgi:hypothetical protein